MSFDLLILVICNIANLGLGLSILLRNPKLRINRVFGFLSLSIILWTTLNYLSDNSAADLTLLFTRLTFVGGVFIAFAIVSLSRYLPNETVLKESLSNKLQAPIAVSVTLLSLTPLVVQQAEPGPEGAVLTVGSLYAVYLLFVLQLMVVVILNFVRQNRAAQSAHQRNQIRLMLVGLLLYGILAIGTNLVLPVLVDNWVSSRFGPLFSLLLVGLTAYAIVKHRLFDVRLAVARSVAYLGTLIAFATIYGFVLFGLTRVLFGIDLPLYVQVVVSSVLAASALFFNYFKRLFDKVTNSLFYRDAYEPQAFFDSFNRALVESADLNALLLGTSKVVQHYLKAEYCLIGVKDGSDGVGYRITGTVERTFSKKDVSLVRSITPGMHQTVILTDELPPERAELRRLLVKNDIALMARLATDLQKTEEGIGYILIGQKKSGNLYNSQDVKVIEAAANELIIAIQNALRFEEIRQFNKTLQAKVDSATEHLQQTNAKLKMLDKSKDEFISMASHQLRTPLTAVKGYVSMVLEGDVGKVSAEQRKVLEQAYESSQRMVFLIGDFLNVSRLQTGKFELELGSVDMAALVREEIDQLSDTAKNKGITLDYSDMSHSLKLQADENKLRQVMMNLIDNAIYYSKPDSKIGVRMVKRAGDLVFEVTDTGIGVPKDEQTQLFTKFFRASNAKRQRPDGTGIGLYMAKKVIVAHGGSIIFESTEGKGSTFGFRLPLKQDPDKLNKQPGDADSSRHDDSTDADELAALKPPLPKR